MIRVPAVNTSSSCALFPWKIGSKSPPISIIFFFTVHLAKLGPVHYLHGSSICVCCQPLALFISFLQYIHFFLKTIVPSKKEIGTLSDLCWMRWWWWWPQTFVLITDRHVEWKWSSETWVFWFFVCLFLCTNKVSRAWMWKGIFLFWLRGVTPEGSSAECGGAEVQSTRLRQGIHQDVSS